MDDVRFRVANRAGSAWFHYLANICGQDGQETIQVPPEIIAIITLFAITGVIGSGIIALKAYKMKLASKLEWARLHAAEDVPEQTLEQIHNLQEQVERLTERVDFTEKLLDSGAEGAKKLSEPSAGIE